MRILLSFVILISLTSCHAFPFFAREAIEVIEEVEELECECENYPPVIEINHLAPAHVSGVNGPMQPK